MTFLDTMQVFLLLPASPHKFPYQENRLHLWQGASLRSLFLNVLAASFLSFHHFVLGTLTRLLRLKRTSKAKIRYNKLMLRYYILSKYHLTI
jgi:hypothetical protein